MCVSRRGDRGTVRRQRNRKKEIDMSPSPFREPSIGKVLEVITSYKTPAVYRAGVIPFFISNCRLFFIVGVDSDHDEYTDFGGGYSVRRDSTVVRTMMRELTEESCSMFRVRYEDIRQSVCVHDNTMMIAFLQIEHTHASQGVGRWYSRPHINTEEQKGKASKAKREISRLVVMDERTMVHEITRGTSYYEKVSKLLKETICHLISTLKRSVS